MRLFDITNRYVLLGLRRIFSLILIAGGLVLPATAQLGSNCTASLLNRTVQVNADGSFALGNIPTNPQSLYRVRVACKNSDGSISRGQSAFISFNSASDNIDIGAIDFDHFTPIPVSLQVSTLEGVTTLGTLGETVHIWVVANYSDGSQNSLSYTDSGTLFVSSNPAIATVDSNGAVTAVSSGVVTISTTNEGVLGAVQIQVLIPKDSDGDGMPDDYEIANGFNPLDPTDAGQDADGDGLTNLQEFLLGTNPHNPDTDGDGIPDGQEVKMGTNPLDPDTDHDGLTDGQELALGTNPLNPDTDGDGIPDGIEVRLGLNPLVPDPTTTVQGRVVDGNGNPVSGAATVVLTFFTSVTDSTGFFTIPFVPADLGNINVLAEITNSGQILDGNSGSKSVIAKGITDVGTIQIAIDAGAVSGIVSDLKGNPVVGDQVTVSEGPNSRTTTTDVIGHYLVNNMVAGPITVFASDPRTGLQGQSTGVLSVNQSVTINVKLGATGTINGVVFKADGVSPVGPGVTVTISGPEFTTTRTDPVGRYSFTLAPLGAFTIDATDSAGNHGRTTGNLSATGETVGANVALLGRATVSGAVKDSGGTPVPNAAVTLVSSSVFGGNLKTTTDASGNYSLDGVFVGPFSVTAQDAIGRRSGQANGTVNSDGQAVTANITLGPAGSIAGVVFRSDGVTPVAGAQVSLSNFGLATTTDGGGNYRFDLLPIGSYLLAAADPSTGDRGTGSASLTTQGQVVQANVKLNGQGQVVVTVVDGGNNTVAGAQVTLTSTTSFGGSQTGVTQADGTVAFTHVLAGGFTVSALNTSTQLAGSANGSVVANGSASITVQLQSAGTILGTIFAPDGTTPVSGITVQLNGQVNRQTVSGGDGIYRFDSVPTSTYTLAAIDGFGNQRASAVNVVLSTQGQQLTENLTLIGIGTVSGQVTNPDGSVAPGVGVTLNSQAPGYNRAFSAQTDVRGNYSISQVPVGNFTVLARQQTNTQILAGTALGQISSNGQQVTENIQLSATNLPVGLANGSLLYDGNGFPFDVFRDGTIGNGFQFTFAGDFSSNRGAMQLDVVSGATDNLFSGQATGTSTQNGQEIDIQQQNLAGLNVTRKVFVPNTGYFARYLDILTNPTANPITINVKLISNIRPTNTAFPGVLATSSGNSAPSNLDGWMTIGDDKDLDPFLAFTRANFVIPELAFVFEGTNAPTSLTTASFNLLPVTINTQIFAGGNSDIGQVQSEWDSVTIPANGAVAFLNFVAQQTSRASALASARRLVQLPPESLAGISANESSEIQNFAVPTTSSVVPLPPLNASVNGDVLASDSTTPIPGATVTFQSVLPYYGRTLSTSSDGNGSFAFNSNFTTSGNNVAIPSATFNLQATIPQTQVQSGLVFGSFDPNNPLVDTQNIVFSNTGIVSGTVTRQEGEVVSQGQIQISGTNLLTPQTVNIGLDGSYAFDALPPGTYTLIATLPNPQGTGLTANTSASVSGGQTTTANLVVPATGAAAGTVIRSDNTVAVNVTVTLQGAGFSRSINTDTGGHFSFTDVPVSTFTLATFDQLTNTAGSAPVSITADQTTTQNLLLVLGGTVTGTITENGAPVSGAQVTLVANNGTFNATTGANGVYTVNKIAPGNVSVQAVDPVSQFHGQASSSLGFSGQTLTLNVQLIASGTVTGTIFHSDGTTPVPGAQITLCQFFFFGCGSVATTDSGGRYIFNSVAVGSFNLDVTDPATGDRGRASNQLNANGEVRTINVNLNGLGTVTVTVRDASNNLIPNAQVTLFSQTQFGGTLAGTTQGNGSVTFNNNVLAGNFFVQATDPATLLGGSTNGNVSVGGTANVTVQLRPAGNIVGLVLAPDGKTPVANVTVRLSGPVVRQVSSANDGSFSFTAVPLGTYTLQVFDGNNQLRAQVTGVTLSTNGQILSQNLTEVGLATVTGTVTNPDSSVAPNVGVTLNSSNSEVGGFFTAGTDSSGIYTIPNVPIGRFTVTASGSFNSQAVEGETSGQITQAGQTVTADIQLVNNAVNLPVFLYDASDFFFNIQSNASIFDGTSSTYRGDFNQNQGAFELNIVSNGTPTAFTGSPLGTQQENGRQITVQEQNLAGLNVSRKVFVPQTGYFARYLEVLTNPTANPITVDVNVVNNIRQPFFCCGFFNAAQIITTSSGDNLLDVSDSSNPDRWVVIDEDSDVDPFQTSGIPSLGFAFDGPNGTQHVGAASFATTVNSATQLSLTWQNITIPAGQTVALMHFGVQQASRSSAAASVQRLVQLPPEALSGLSAAELSEIQNFAIPSGGVSALAPLPPLNGNISGQVLGGDGVTPDPNAPATFKSNNIYFGRTFTTGTDGQANFNFASTFNNFGSSLPIPLDAFTLTATDNTTGAQAPPTTGTFAPGQTTAVQNIVFTNTGLVTGTVQRSTGAPVTTGGFVQYISNGFFRSVSIGSDGTFKILSATPGDLQLTAFLFEPQCCTELTGTTVAHVIAGQAVTANIAIQPAGSISGTVTKADGSPAASVQVFVSTNNLFRETFTAGDGSYTLVDVLAGTTTVQAIEPVTGIASTLQTIVVADQTTTNQNLSLIALGTLQVQVNSASGIPVSGSQVNVEYPGQNFFNFRGFTDATGALTIPSVPIGTSTVQAFNPNNSNLRGTATATITQNGQTVPVTVTLPAFGTVTGKVTNADGTVAPNSIVEICSTFTFYYFFSCNNFFGEVNTDSSGNYSIGFVPAGQPFTVRAGSPSNFNFYTEVDGQSIASDGGVLTLNITLPAIANVHVTVQDQSGNPVANSSINIENALQPFFQSAGRTGTDGTLTIPNVPQGNFTVQAFNPNNFTLLGTATGTVLSTDQGNTINVTITSPFFGTIQGTVFAGDGSTPVPFTDVQITDTANGGFVANAFTDQNGTYNFSGTAPGDGSGFTITAFSPSRQTSSSQNSNFTSANQTVTLNFTLPISVITGTVTYADGVTPVPNPQVMVTDSNNNTFFSVSGGASVGSASATKTSTTKTSTTGASTTSGTSIDTQAGQYIVFEPAVGSVSAFSQDPNTGLPGTATGAVADITVPVTINIALGPSGTVTGTVTDASGNPVSSANLQLVSPNNFGFIVFARPDGNGVYTYNHIPVGPFTIQEFDFNNGMFASVSDSTSLVHDGDTATVNIVEPAIGVVQGQVLDQGGNPVPRAGVRIDNFDSVGPQGNFSTFRNTAADGSYVVSGVQAGNIRVTALPSPAGTPNPLDVAGIATGQLTSSGPLTLNVTLGNGVTFNTSGVGYDLDGHDGFRYDPQCNGSLVSGGTTDGTTFVNAYNFAYFQNVGGWSFNCQNAGLLAQNNREIDLGPQGSSQGRFLVTRKIFSPLDGRFARYLEVVSNNTNFDMTVPVAINGNVGSGSNTTIVTDPSTTNNTYAVTACWGGCGVPSPSLGYVVGDGTNVTSTFSFGVNVPTLAARRAQAAGNDSASTSSEQGNGSFSYSWNVKVPAGQTVILMHFALQAPDDPTATQEAQALVTLTDPDALDGLSATEKAEIVNFSVAH